ncbi:MAG TPA: hypothetical protein VNM67_08305 [Thermoanaerobaculia bacterium]|nr:hypothetical protein [Thermoanaerobaculia bacterium]
MQTWETHPSPEQIERLILAKSDPAESQRAVRHLLRGCPECQNIARAVWYRTQDPRARLVLMPVKPRS